MRFASLLFRGVVIVTLVAALSAGVARAQTSQPGGDSAYGQQAQPQSDDQSATSQNSDSGEDNPSARPDPDDSSGSTDSDQNTNESNDSDSSGQENR